MKRVDLDRALSTDDDLVPSAGFASSVMDLVKAEAGGPPPIPFPWARAAVGMAATLLLTAAVGSSALAEWTAASTAATVQGLWSAALTLGASGADNGGAIWTAAALALAIVSTLLPLRLGRERA